MSWINKILMKLSVPGRKEIGIQPSQEELVQGEPAPNTKGYSAQLSFSTQVAPTDLPCVKTVRRRWKLIFTLYGSKYQI